MKIIILGGAGEMGSRAAQELAADPEVSLLTIADRNQVAAEKVVKSLEGKGAAVDARIVNALDHTNLVAALRGYDVAAGALGPYFMFETTLIRAALDAGVNYCSICDEWEPAEAAIDGFDGEARQKGLTVITGLGASPGITNVGVRYLAQKMDILRKVEIALFLPLDCGAQGAALRHALHIMSGQMVVWRNGRRTMIKACTEKRRVDFPRFGMIDVWNMGHSEPATIPRYFPGVQEVDFFMGFGAGTAPIVLAARWGAFAGERRARFFVNATEFFEKIFAGPEPGWGAIRIDAWGEKDGQAVHHLLCGTGQMRETTGLSLAAGAYLLGKRQLTTTAGGVYAPEGCLEPGAFFQYFLARGLRVYEDVEMKRPWQ